MLWRDHLCTSTRFSSQGETVHRGRKSRCLAADQGQPKRHSECEDQEAAGHRSFEGRPHPPGRVHHASYCHTCRGLKHLYVDHMITLQCQFSQFLASDEGRWNNKMTLFYLMISPSHVLTLTPHLVVGTILTVSFGYTHQQALIFAVPMGFIGICVVILNGFLSDKVCEPIPHKCHGGSHLYCSFHSLHG